jgi:hypothetical protein
MDRNAERKFPRLRLFGTRNGSPNRFIESPTYNSHLDEDFGTLSVG